MKRWWGRGDELQMKQMRGRDRGDGEGENKSYVKKETLEVAQ